MTADISSFVHYTSLLCDSQDPSKFAAAAVAVAAPTAAKDEPKKEEKKEESEDEDDGDMGFGLFDQTLFFII